MHACIDHSCFSLGVAFISLSTIITSSDLYIIDLSLNVVNFQRME